jgi:hypothetical protein
MAIDIGAVFSPPEGTRMFLDGINFDGRQVRWTIQLDNGVLWVPNKMQEHPWEFNLHAHIVDAQFFASIEDRLKNQRESIDRLVNHLKEHCPQLIGVRSCEHMPV